MADRSFISEALQRGAELDRDAGLEKCAAIDCVRGRDFTTTDGICHWCNGTGFRGEPR